MVQGVRERKQLERRERIVTAAMGLAGQGGYDAVQVRVMADEADVAVGTIYRYFGSKDVVLLEGLAGWIRLIADEILANPVPGNTAAERLMHVTTVAAAKVDRQPKLMSALITALSSTDPQTAAARGRIDRYFTRMLLGVLNGDAEDHGGALRVLGHVWFSAVTTWVSGRADDGHVAAELENAIRQMFPVD